METTSMHDELTGAEIAIIGMAGRFPGAEQLELFWQNLRDGVESISFFEADELTAAGVDPRELADPHYVRAAPVLSDIESFDAGFFGYTAREAELMDPQQRLLLECAWTALEDAGYDPEQIAERVGVFAGTKTNTYLFTLAANRELVSSIDFLQLVLGGDAALLSTRISYKLNLKGPSYAVQTACSSSLVAVHLACQSLLLGECELALAGAVAVNVPHVAGYRYQPGGILSPDGHCRPFDAQAAGTVFGSGVGTVVLKKLGDALSDGDTIHAVIKGSATNNDGSHKASFTAPSVEGQASVIIDALACAGVDAESISYLEAHGTGTALGDPIEVQALSEAFRASTAKSGFCALGSVKSNIGHLDAAAGMSSLIKTVLALKHRQIPPSLHFEQPNPQIDFARTPFYVNTALLPWKWAGQPRRAGVSSFGFGGTNAHVILEEAPAPPPAAPADGWRLLVLSARSAAALDQATANLREHLARHPELALADVAHTLQQGRKAWPYRRALACHDLADACAVLAEPDSQRLVSGQQQQGQRRLAFLFPGQGTQYVGMGHDLYERQPAFRQAVDQCAALLQPHLGLDLRALLYPAPAQQATAADLLAQTAMAQPALFTIGYALAQLWSAWGLAPAALIGHSIGEYVAATRAGVFALPDALRLVAARGRLMQALPPGAMLAVPRAPAELAPLLGDQAWLAAVNGPRQCVVAGAPEAVTQLAASLADQGVVCQRLHTSHAFHTPLVEPMLDAFRAVLADIPLQPPTLPLLSNVTGTWATEEIATADYWVQHVRAPVQFAAGVATLLEGEEERVFLELGPGQTLGTLLRQQVPGAQPLASLRAAVDARADEAVLLTTLGRLWVQGVAVDWTRVAGDGPRRRVPLPTYPFERTRYWIESGPAPAPRQQLRQQKQPCVADWLYRQVWQPAPLLATAELNHEQGLVLIFDHAPDVRGGLAERVRQQGLRPTIVVPGNEFARLDEWTYSVDPRRPEDYRSLLGALPQAPRQVVHLWTLAPVADGTERAVLDEAQQRGFYSLLYLAQALGELQLPAPLDLVVVSSGLYAVAEDDRLDPARAMLGGPCLVIPQEHPQISCRLIDLAWPDDGCWPSALLEQVVAEVRAPSGALASAYRGLERWAPSYTPLAAPEGTPLLRQGGVYLLAGGLGGIGYAVAGELARGYGARLALLGRGALPPRAEWDGWLATHPEHDEQSRKIGQVRQLEALGAQVLVLSADLANGPAVRAAVDETLARFGALHGVFHIAGPGRGEPFRAIRQTTAQDCRQHFAPKVDGVLALEQALRGLELDFCLLFSSLSTVLGGLGNVAYAAANLYLDAFAQRQARAGRGRWISAAWDSWHRAEQGASALGTTLVDLAIAPEEGVEALRQLLTVEGDARPIISTGRLEERLSQWVRRDLLRQAASHAGAASTARPAPSAPRSPRELEERIGAVWQQVLGVAVGPHDNFFDLGGNSLLGMQLIGELKSALDVQVAPVTLFEAPTVSALARVLSDQQPGLLPAPAAPAPSEADAGHEIAIIGMAGRFPGADDVASFWRNLCAGAESISFFTQEELAAAGVADELLGNPHYVKARPILSDVKGFDAGFFGYSPREAELMDPQHRVFLECAWEALEDGGYAGAAERQTIGVYAGASLSTYLLNLYAHPEIARAVDPLQIIIGNASDSLTTSVSYKLNLKGPSVAVQTFCSTSLVAVHMACQSLRAGECELALAGGVSIAVPQQSGYLHHEEGITSPDGHCRPFAADAAGTLFGDGAGVVLLKPLAAARAAGDHIYAVVKGSAINNDGSLKAGYTAPSVDRQAEVVVAALADAGVQPETIGYVEAHGTGTRLGDPIEVLALTKAFRTGTAQTAFCGLGSVKGNIGHLDRAAGVAALIKAALALRHGRIPPSLYAATPNPAIDFASSPFYVNAELTEWPAGAQPRRAGVSALGFGGTNAHVILEQPPQDAPASASRPWQLLLLSAKTPAALDAVAGQLAGFLRGQPDELLPEVAYTLQTGRKAFEQRRVVLCRGVDDAVAALEGHNPQQVWSRAHEPQQRGVIFLFPGQGSQAVDMGRGLYEREPLFRAEVDRCLALLRDQEGLDLRAVLYPEPGERERAAELLGRTAFTQPALFVISYALAQLWQAWGVRPAALLGHSIGEYVAATLAGVFSLEEALTLVAARGRLMQELEAGAMLAVRLPERELRPLLGPELSIAAINTPAQCVVSGPSRAVETLATLLAARGVEHKRLHTSHAFHSTMMEPIVGAFAQLVGRVALNAPRLPYISCVSGTWITAEQATSPAYWADHLRRPVRFSDGIQTVLADQGALLLEVGAGQTLLGLARQHLEQQHQRLLVPSLGRAAGSKPDDAAMLAALGQLWLAGVEPDWPSFYAGEQRRRLPLPTYPFERRPYWVEARAGERHTAFVTAGQPAEPGVQLSLPAWRRSPLRPAKRAGAEQAGQDWLIFADAGGLGAALGERLTRQGQRAITVTGGQQLLEHEPARWSLDPQQPGHYQGLLTALAERGQPPRHVLHLWNVLPQTILDDMQAGCAAEGLTSVLLLARALEASDPAQPARLWVLSTHAHSITGEEPIRPEQAALSAVCRAITRELRGVICRQIDLALPREGGAQLAERLAAEISAETADQLVAYRGQHRWLPSLEPLSAELGGGEAPPQGDAAVYLITNGLEGPGYELAALLARQPGAGLILAGAACCPPREQWQRWLAGAEEPLAEARVLAEDSLRRLELRLETWQAEIERRTRALSLSVPRPPDGLEQAVDALCASYAYAYLAEAVDASPGRGYERRELREALGVMPKFAKFLDYMLALLRDDGIITFDGERLSFTSEAGRVEEPQTLLRAIQERYPEAAGSLWALDHCASQYREALSGAVEAVSVLYPNGSSEMLLAVTEEQARFSNLPVHLATMAQLIREAAAQAGRALRVLEIGAGDGKLTWELLAALAGVELEYHFTDLGKSFLASAEKKAGQLGYDFMEFGLLDVSKDPATQGYAPYSFDVVVALDVVHATEQLAGTLQQLGKLLVPGGAMLILEPTRPQRWVTMIWGLAEGWWYFSDAELRQLSPLLTPEQWEQLLRRQELGHTAVYPLAGEERRAADHSLLVAQQPATIATDDYRRWTEALALERQAAVRGTIERALRLEQAGARVAVLTVDPLDATRLDAAVDEAERQLGPLRGVIHAPDEPPAGRAALARLRPRELRRALAREEHALRALDAALRGRRLEAALLITALAAFSGAGSPGAAALGLALDACAHACRERGGLPWMSVSWDRDQAGDQRGRSEPGAAAVLRYLLTEPLPQQLIVTTQQRGAAEASWNSVAELRRALTDSMTLALHPRPQLASDYAAPSGETEQIVAAIWQDLLGVAAIGAHDSFFELGGDSLVATQLGSRLQDRFQLDIPLRSFFENPTIAALARLIDSARESEQSAEELEILQLLSQLSPEELTEELEKRNLSTAGSL